MPLSFYICGSNISGQIGVHNSTKCYFVCCPVKFHSFSGNNLDSTSHQVYISLYHFIWKNGTDWMLNGFQNQEFQKYHNLLNLSDLVKSSEKRLVFLDENGDVRVATSSGLKLLQLQYAKEKEVDTQRSDGTSEKVEIQNSDGTAEKMDTHCSDAEKVQVKDIAVEDNALLIIDTKGRLFSSGIHFPLFGKKIKEVSLGKEHCLALTDDGIPLSWGSGMRGQLGNGEIITVESPEVIEALQGLVILSICAGGWHSAALSDSGDVYMWGWNDVGQLGFRSKALKSDGVKWDDILGPLDCKCPSMVSSSCSARQSSKVKLTSGILSQSKLWINLCRTVQEVNVQATPKLLDYWIEDISVKKIACGDRHTVFLLENGTAWTTGWNVYGQLGIGSNISKDEPHLVPLGNVGNVFAGGWNSVFLVQEEEDVQEKEKKVIETVT